jgi:hypothetical protein
MLSRGHELSINESWFVSFFLFSFQNWNSANNLSILHFYCWIYNGINCIIDLFEVLFHFKILVIKNCFSERFSVFVTLSIDNWCILVSFLHLKHFPISNGSKNEWCFKRLFIDCVFTPFGKNLVNYLEIKILFQDITRLSICDQSKFVFKILNVNICYKVLELIDVWNYLSLFFGLEGLPPIRLVEVILVKNVFA